MKANRRTVIGTALAIALGCALWGSTATAQSLDSLTQSEIPRLADTLHLNGLKPLAARVTTLALESRAYNWSKCSFLVPMAVGSLVLKLQKRKHVQEYGSNGQVVWDHYEDPDHTLPVALICGGLILGPSAGYFAGGCPERGLSGILLRTATAGLTVGIVAVAANAAKDDEFLDFSNIAAAVTFGAVGATAILFEAAYDISHVKQAVRLQALQKKKAVVSVAPALFGGGNAPGMELKVIF
jgi:hypothetical protein